MRLLGLTGYPSSLASAGDACNMDNRGRSNRETLQPIFDLSMAVGHSIQKTSREVA